MLFNLPDLDLKLPRTVLIGLACALLALIGLGTWSLASRHRTSRAASDARQAALVATTEKAAAQAGDKEIKRWREHLKALDHDTAEAKDRQVKVDTTLPARRAKVAQLQATVDPNPTADPIPPDELVKRLRALNQSQAELIQTLELAVSSRDEVIADQAAALDGRDQLLTAAFEDRDHWQASAIAREQQATAERIARDAQAAASKANLWVGRAEGGGAVAGTVYVLHLLGVL